MENEDEEVCRKKSSSSSRSSKIITLPTPVVDAAKVENEEAPRSRRGEDKSGCDEQGILSEQNSTASLVQEAQEKIKGREISENDVQIMNLEKNQETTIEKVSEETTEIQTTEKQEEEKVVENEGETEQSLQASLIVSPSTPRMSLQHIEEEFAVDKNLIIQPKKNDGEPIEIEVKGKTKPFLGGFKNTKTGVTYHHAQVQTESSPKKKIKKFTRETQTKVMKTKSAQSTREYGTQMSKKDLLIDNRNDFERILGVSYVNSKELEKLKKEKIIVVQCAVRQWLARKESMKRMKAINAERERIKNQLEEMKLTKIDKENKSEKKRNHPKTISDFQRLEREVTEWRVLRTKEILNQNFCESEQIQALSELVEKEVEKLKEIENKKIKALKSYRQKRKFAQLNKMCENKKWLTQYGEEIDVETPYITRAKYLSILYQALQNKVQEDERVDILGKVIEIIQEFYHLKICGELSTLIEREIDMIQRQRPPNSLKGLKKRIVTLFWQFIINPECNPEAARFQKIPGTIPKIIRSVMTKDEDMATEY